MKLKELLELWLERYMKHTIRLELIIDIRVFVNYI